MKPMFPLANSVVRIPLLSVQADLLIEQMDSLLFCHEKNEKQISFYTKHNHLEWRKLMEGKGTPASFQIQERIQN